MRTQRIAAIAAGLATALLASVGPAEATFPGANGKIAFHSNRAGTYDIFAANPDGTGLVNLTATPGADELDPAWSPDGRRLAYRRDDVRVSGAVWVMNADGSGQTQLTGGSAASQSDGRPAWSPDGTEIVLARSDSLTGDQGLWVIPAVGGAARRLTTGGDTSPSWSPDGRTIAFERHPPRLASRLALVPADGTGSAQIVDTGNSSSDGNPSWSPDGTRLAIDVNGGEAIVVVRPDGTRVAFVGLGRDPEWSPDGSAIAYNATSGSREIEWRALDGSAGGNLSGGGPADDGAPTWQPVTAGRQVSIVDAPSVVEGDAGAVAATFEVSLSAPAGAPVTVDFTTADGTAVAGSDYQATAGALTFAAGETRRTISVLVDGDALSEPDETFEVRLSNATNATIGNQRATGRILDDDALPSASIGNASAVEGDAGTTPVSVTVTLSSAAAGPVTVGYTTVDSSATAPDDYVAASGTVSFAPGDTSETITVLVEGDLVSESPEQFLVKLTTASNATLGLADEGAVSIVDDDPTVATVRRLGSVAVYDADPAVPAANDVTVSATGTTVRIHDASGSLLAGAGCSPVGGTGDVQCSFVTAADLETGPLADRVVVNGAIATTIDGGAGADVLTGGAGDDALTGGLGSDTLDGAGGSDVLVETAGVDLTLTDGSLLGLGTDSVSRIERALLLGAGTSPLTFDASAFTGATVLVGGTGADRLIGGSGRDDIRGTSATGDADGAADVISGGPQDDAFTVDAADTVKESADVDFVLTTTPSSPAAATLTGLGTDTMSAAPARVWLTGGPGNNTLDASAYQGAVTLEGQGGSDTLRGARGIDSLDGGAGDDSLASDDGLGGEQVACGPGVDTVVADAGDLLGGCEDATVKQQLPAGGGTVAGPPGSVQATVSDAQSGPVTIRTRPAAAAPTAWSFLGQQVDIAAPQGTVASPIVVVFLIDASLLPAGVTAANLEVFRNGALVPPCTGPAGQAVPTPCVSARQTAGTSARITVLTVAASAWALGVPLTSRGVVAGALQTSNGAAAAFLAASDGRKVAGALAFRSYRSTSAVALAVSGRKAWLAGLGADGRPFLAYLEDKGPNGRGDVFRLWIGGVEQTTDGRLAAGDVAVAG